MKYTAYGTKYESTPMRVKFIPVKNGDLIDMGNTGLLQVSGAHKLVGFKPATGKNLAGWLVILVNEQATGAPRKKRELKAVA